MSDATIHTANDVHAVERGWTVNGRNGNKIGTVEEVTETAFVIGSGDDAQFLPLVALAHVDGKNKLITLDLTAEDVQHGDFSQPPDHAPRRDVALTEAGLAPEIAAVHGEEDEEAATEADRLLRRGPDGVA